MHLIYITKSPEEARVLQAAGVDRIMVDLEINGKEARQGHLNTVISRHVADDVSALRAVLDRSELLVRVNPVFAGTAAEVDDVIARGAGRVMLPMFTHPDDVTRFADVVAGRVPITLLVETPQALARLPAILATGACDDVHIGLNDLHLGLGLDFMFELLSGGVVDHAAGLLRAAGIRFGFGGVAPLGDGRLPAELILSEHARLGSSAVILARGFRRLFEDAETVDAALGPFADQVQQIRDYVGGTPDFDANRAALVHITRSISDEIRSKNRG